MVEKKRDGGFVEIFDGVSRQNLVYGAKTHMLKFFLEGGKVIPVHTHEQEQTGYLIRGKMKMTIDGISHDLEDGASWSIESNVPHGVEVFDDCSVIEVFSPPRKEYFD